MLLMCLVVCALLPANVVYSSPIAAASSRRCGRVHLTVSSIKDGYLELNWITECNASSIQPNTISLSDKDPNSREELNLLESIHVANHPSGFYRTKVKFKDVFMPANWDYSENLNRTEPGKHCFPYYIISATEDGQIIDSQCLAIQPTWMSDHRDVLQERKIHSVLIPGTHNSGAYDGSKVPAPVQLYVLNQDKIIWSQLVFGIRYLDLRIGYYNLRGFYINHDGFRITPLEPVLKQIRKFVELTEEIVIVDFHRFPYPKEFGEELHRLLTDLIFKELGEFAFDRKSSARKGVLFKELWNQEKRLIISYSHDATVTKHQWLWRGIPQYWADTVNTNVLKNYMADKISNHNLVGDNPFWALMAELTPRFMDIILLRNNLRKLADDVNRELTKWFRDEWAEFTVNIVATDFFLGNDLINVAIEEVETR